MWLWELVKFSSDYYHVFSEITRLSPDGGLEGCCFEERGVKYEIVI